MNKTKVYGMLGWFYIKNLLLCFDQLGNCLVAGDPDETISRRAGRACGDNQGWGCTLCKWLDKFDKRHCQKAVHRTKHPEGENSTIQTWKRWKLEHGV